MLKKYVKKPVVIEAIQWDNTNFRDILKLNKDGERQIRIDDENNLHIFTLEGTMIANVGDYIIKGIKGELYPCKLDIFEATYEAVEEGNE